ncbi:MAG: hypothetical protein H6679_03800 [Epsilonproteobacteria bacterium]|nr:hypothetical protein [Campylobacterota bacterium]
MRRFGCSNSLKKCLIMVLILLQGSALFCAASKKRVCRDGETIEGFVPLNGVSLPSKSDVYFNVPLPVQGIVEFGADCTMHLMSDLHTASHINFAIGQNCSDCAYINGQGYTLFLGGDINVPASRSLHIAGDLTIDGNGYTICFEDLLSEIYVHEHCTLTLRNLILRGWDGNCQLAGQGRVVLQDCEIDLSPEMVAEYEGDGEVEVRSLVSVQGGGKLVFGGRSSLKIDSFSTLWMDSDTTLHWKNQTRTGLVMVDETSRIFLNGGNIHADAKGENKGLQLTKGTLLLDNRCMIQNDGNTSATRSFQLGDGRNTANDVDVKVLAGALVEVDGYMDFNPAR